MSSKRIIRSEEMMLALHTVVRHRVGVLTNREIVHLLAKELGVRQSTLDKLFKDQKYLRTYAQTLDNLAWEYSTIRAAWTKRRKGK